MRPEIEQRITAARSRIAANLGELQERATTAKEIVSPSTYLQSPWLKVGIGFVVGWMIARSR